MKARPALTLVSYKMFAILSKKKMFAIGTSPFAEKKQNVCDQENLVLARKKKLIRKKKKDSEKINHRAVSLPCYCYRSNSELMYI